jgi:hypothetical protein
VLLEGARYFSVQSLKPFAQRLEILARIAHAELMAGTMLAGRPIPAPQRSVAAPTPSPPGGGRHS